MVSKRKLRELVDGRHVEGWDDPRMPTLSGMRRRGYPAAAIRKFCEKVGITKVNSVSDVALLEHAVRDELNRTAIRRMAVFDPLEVELTNWTADKVIEVDAVNNPEDDSAGTRKVPFSRHLIIEQDDFKEEANRKFFRLKKGGEVRLRYAYIIRCDEVVKDADGKIIKLLCTVDHDTLNKQPEDRKVKGVIHWVSAEHASKQPVRLFDRLFTEEQPDADRAVSFINHLNPDSLQEAQALCEPSLLEMQPGEQCQFERIGYFCADNKLSKPGAPVFNRTVALRDTWARIASKVG